MKIKIHSSRMSHKSTNVSLVIVLMMDSSNVDILRKGVLKILKKLKISTLKFMFAHTIIVKKNSIWSQGSSGTK